jgi:predicted alpha/beta-fold hydrolase
MPVIRHSDCNPPAWLFNGHLQTIVPSTFRRVYGVLYQRERIETPDGDFLDLDWAHAPNRPDADQLVIISHGLEGSSDRHYVKGMAKVFNRVGWDALAWNCRGCSGEMNRLPRFYHHGDSDDLRAVLRHALSKGKYHEVVLVGFSMGGSMTLKLLGEKSEALPAQVTKAITFSVPCDLVSSVAHLSTPANAIYRRRFLKKLERKILLKSQLLLEHITYRFDDIRLFRDFDNRYTAPLHGFRDADDFYERASARHYLAGIRIPTLLVNAANDPFLTESCYPVKVAENHPYLYLEIPRYGGHVGFSQKRSTELWSERRAVAFAMEKKEG